MLKYSLLVKSIFREWRSGELSLLCITLIIAVTCISAINNFSFIAQQQLERGAAQLLGADAVLKSNKPIESAWKQKADKLGIIHNYSLLFQSMVAAQDHLQLTQIKAITTPYPLQGNLKISKKLSDLSGQLTTKAPEQGTVWLSPRLFPLLATDIGQSLQIGVASFKITGVIREEPGQVGAWFSIAPKLIINEADLSKTKTIQRGSVLTYNWLLKGTPQQLEQLHQFISNQLNSQQEWKDSQKNISSYATLEQSLNYFYFASLMSLILAGIAISMASLRYCQRHIKQVALLRCFGAKQKNIMQLYLSNLVVVGLFSSSVGALLGYALQPLLLKWLGGLLPYSDWGFNLGPFVLSILTGILFLFCFATGNFWKLHKISALSLFRQQQLLWENTTYLTYLIALFLLAILTYSYTHSIKLLFIVLLSILGFIGFALGGLWLLFGSINQLKMSLPLNWRFGFNNIARNLENSTLQVVGVGLALATMLCLVLLKEHLISDWQQQLPAQTPNYFIFNIEPEQKLEVQQYLRKYQINNQTFYPIWRARLTEINNQSVTSLFGEQAKTINALQRELNLSSTFSVPEGNKIVQGKWFSTNSQRSWVSIEQSLANQLKLGLGDTLSFDIGDKIIKVQVSSIRTVDWNSFKPNFFMLFKPGVLNHLPHTVLTSFYLPTNRHNVLNEMNQQFPNVSIIDVAQTIKTIQNIIDNTGKALSLITSFALLAGFIVVTLAFLALSEAKKQETQLLKFLGMSRRSLLWIRSSEALLIGLYSGLLATAIALIMNALLATIVFRTFYTIPWRLFIVVPGLTSFFVVFLNLIIQHQQYKSIK